MRVEVCECGSARVNFILCHITETVVVEPLGDGTRGRVNHEADAALHVVDEAVGGIAISNHN